MALVLKTNGLFSPNTWPKLIFLQCLVGFHSRCYLSIASSMLGRARTTSGRENPPTILVASAVATAAYGTTTCPTKTRVQMQQ